MRRPWPRRAAWLWCCLALGGRGRPGGSGAAGLHVRIPPERIDALSVMPLYDVGLAPGAVVSLNIRNALPVNETVLVILSRGQWAAWVRLVNQHRWQQLPGGSFSTYLISHWRQPFSGELVAQHTICAPSPDHYYVLVVNTHSEAMVLEGSISYVNPGGQHLPLQQAHLPETLWASSVAFVFLLCTVVMLLSSVWHREATLLHALLVACLWLKSAELSLKWKYVAFLGLLGRAPPWLHQVWQLTAKLHEIGEIFLLLITALGWRVLRPRLTATEIHFAALAMVLAATLAVFEVCSDAWATQPFVSFKLLFYFVRVACYLVIIFAMNFNLQLIALHLAESPVTASIAVLYRKQQAYISFRRIFLAIVFRPSLVIWLRLSVLDEEGTQWAVDAFQEASAWLIYAALFLALRPSVGRSRLFRLVRAVMANDASTQTGEGAAAEPRPSLPRLPAPAPAAGSGGEGLSPEAGLATPYTRLADGE